MTDMKTRVAIIDNSIDPEVYNPVLHWGRWLTGDWESFRAPDGRLPSLGGGGITHIILTGSEASILEREAWVDREVEFVRDALGQGLPILGSCYGHQLLALAVGGPDCVRRTVEPEFGWVPIRIDEESALLGPAGVAYAFTLHFDEVAHRPDLYRVFASTTACPVQAVQYGDRPAWGIQSHPEISVEDGRAVLEAEIRGGYKGLAGLVRALEAPPRDSGLIKVIVPAFLRS
jgi:GMP synthase-like glutamine amidotransferase